MQTLVSRFDSEQQGDLQAGSSDTYVSLSPLFSASQHLLSLPLICLLICTSDLSAWNRFSLFSPPQEICNEAGLTLPGQNKARELISCILMLFVKGTHTHTLRETLRG